jgi:hypothetical protein
MGSQVHVRSIRTDSTNFEAIPPLSPARGGNNEEEETKVKVSHDHEDADLNEGFCPSQDRC